MNHLHNVATDDDIAVASHQRHWPVAQHLGEGGALLLVGDQKGLPSDRHRGFRTGAAASEKRSNG